MCVCDEVAGLESELSVCGACWGMACAACGENVRRCILCFARCAIIPNPIKIVVLQLSEPYCVQRTNRLKAPYRAYIHPSYKSRPPYAVFSTLFGPLGSGFGPA